MFVIPPFISFFERGNRMPNLVDINFFDLFPLTTDHIISFLSAMISFFAIWAAKSTLNNTILELKTENTLKGKTELSKPIMEFISSTRDFITCGLVLENLLEHGFLLKSKVQKNPPDCNEIVEELHEELNNVTEELQEAKNDFDAAYQTFYEAFNRIEPIITIYCSAVLTQLFCDIYSIL